MILMTSACLLFTGCQRSSDQDEKTGQETEAKKEKKKKNSKKKSEKDKGGDDAQAAFEAFAKNELTQIEEFNVGVVTEKDEDEEFSYYTLYPNGIFGLIDYCIADFDGDGEDEMVGILLSDDDGSGHESLSAGLYEYSGEVEGVDDYSFGDGVLEADESDTFAFTYDLDGRPVIGLMAIESYYTRADGMHIYYTVLGASDGSFDVIGKDEYAGSDMEDTGFAKKLKKCGIDVDWEDLYGEDGKDAVLSGANGTLVGEVVTTVEQVSYDENYMPEWIDRLIDIYGALHSGTSHSSQAEPGVVCFAVEEGKSGSCKVDYDMDGNEDTLKFRFSSDDGYAIDTLEVEAGNLEMTIDEGLDGYPGDGLQCAWFTTKRGKQYLYVQWDLDNGYTGTSVYAFFQDGSFEYLGEEGSIFFETMEDAGNWVQIEPESPDDFCVEYMEQKLGTQFYSVRCKIGSDGLPEATDEFGYYIGNYDYFGITANEDLPAMIVDSEGYLVQESEIGKDVGICPYRTDGLTFIDVFTDEGDELIRRLYIEQDEDGYYVLSGDYGFKSNRLTDLFDGLMFPG